MSLILVLYSTDTIVYGMVYTHIKHGAENHYVYIFFAVHKEVWKA